MDDSEITRELVEVVLRSAGASVIFAENGKAGLDLANRCGFDLILMDIQMPVMDGHTATRQLRELGCQAPIFALTAHDSVDDQRKCLESGFTGYLSKPIEPRLLLQTVREALAQESSQVSRTTKASIGSPTSGKLASKYDPITVDELPLSRLAQLVASAATDGPIKSTLPTHLPEFREVVEDFVRSLRENLALMQKAYETDDFDTLAELAHRLKGSGGTIGFHCFTMPARRLEKLALKREREPIRNIIATLNHYANRIVVAS